MVTTSVLARARAGDGEAFRELTEPYRRELQLHCYRILGSVQDAEDMLQETLLAAWRGLDRFEERASVRAWLYKIATNRCLNALRDSGRRPRPAAAPGLADPPSEPTRRAEPLWLQPYPDALTDDLPTPRPVPKPATRAGKRSPWPSWPGCSACRHGSALSWCCATCSATPPPRPPRCWRPARSR